MGGIGGIVGGAASDESTGVRRWEVEVRCGGGVST
jgi:hypothetical protein